MMVERSTSTSSIIASLAAIGVLASCMAAPAQSRSTLTEPPEDQDAIRHAERSCQQLMTTMIEAHATGGDADLQEIYSNLHYRMALADEALIQVESMSALMIASGWMRLGQSVPHLPHGNPDDSHVNTNTYHSHVRQALNGLLDSCTAIIDLARSLKSLEAESIAILDDDFSMHGLVSIKPLLAKLIAKDIRVLRSLTDLRSSIRALQTSIDPSHAREPIKQWPPATCAFMLMPLCGVETGNS